LHNNNVGKLMVRNKEGEMMSCGMMIKFHENTLVALKASWEDRYMNITIP
jgi:hypothetical protein